VLRSARGDSGRTESDQEGAGEGGEGGGSTGSNLNDSNGSSRRSFHSHLLRDVLRSSLPPAAAHGLFHLRASSSSDPDHDWMERLGRGERPGTGEGAYPVLHESGRAAIAQTVILGAGMDARAFRLSCFTRNPQATVFELDQAPVVRIKNRLIEQAIREGKVEPTTCKRVTVECDFSVAKSDQQATADSSSPSLLSRARTLLFGPPPLHWTSSLLSRGFSPSSPSCWLMEGLLMYLSEREQLALVKDLSGVAAVGSMMGLSHVNEKALRNATRPSPTIESPPPAAASASSSSSSPAPDGTLIESSTSRRSIAPQYRSLLSQWRSFLSAAFLSCLRSHGWEVLTLTQLGAGDASYGAWAAQVFPIEDEEKGRVLYLLAVKVR
jgi:hypothetical protein